jgi:copper chaperone CopZ
MMIEGDLEDAGAKKASCSYARQELEVEFDGKLSEEKVREIVEKSGYRIL